MKIEIDLEKLDWICEEYGHKDGKRYYIYDPKYGYFSKKEADVITEFLRKNFLDIIYKSENK